MTDTHLIQAAPPSVSVVVPVYNSEPTLVELASRLVDVLTSLGGDFEIILVNDGSPDGSAAVCRRLAARTDLPVTFIDLSRNFGEHNAVTWKRLYVRPICCTRV